MIISASRRTDIPAYFSDWFFNRLHDKFVFVKNPMNPRQISRVSLDSKDIDGIVLWTKNPLPMLGRLHTLSDIPYYFQFTLTSYGRDIESGLPSKNDVLIPAFISLSKMIGPERIVWRYDPIILTAHYTLDYHIRYFEAIAKKLCGYTSRCTISFLDIYRNTEKNLHSCNLKSISSSDIDIICSAFSEIASKYGLRLSTCAEAIDLDKYNIDHARCINPDIFESITGHSYKHSKDANQRAECGCISSVDIGAYNCCANGCLYCYANYNPALIKSNLSKHNPHSPLLIGTPEEDDIIIQRHSISAIKKHRHKDTMLDI